MPDRQERLPLVLFGLFLALCVTFALTFVIEEVPFEDIPLPSGGVERVTTGHGTTHDQFPSMDHAGPGGERRGAVWWLGLSFGLLQLAIIFGCLALPVKRLALIRTPLALCGLVLAAIFVAMAVSYRGYAGDGMPALIFSLPIPTAWFLYAFWPAQFFVVALYVLLFSRAFVTPVDIARFREILAKRRLEETTKT
ncbi:MAG: hypothetical protein QF681_13725 [Vicinamibacterales bacterium]|jgi:uncharacterized membrane protein YhaH (DUF805 family)|nr:hypothetical protein [Vicinamibacterales bacterium]